MDIRLVLNVEPSCSALSIKSLCNGPLNSCIPAKSRIYTMQVHCCRWKGCKDIFDSYESLFAHVSESHIGRKRQGNLCLDCKWDGCDFDCSKRDHIISHMKVHVPLKAFKCTKCPKAFKRAQDLSKHQRLHLSNLCESQRVAKYTFKSCGHYVHPQQHSTNPWSRNTDWIIDCLTAPPTSNLFDASVTSFTNLSQMTYKQCPTVLEMMIVDWIACISFILLFMWYFELVCVAADCVHQTVSYSKASCLQPEDDLSSKPPIVEQSKFEGKELVQQLNAAENDPQTVVEISLELAGYAYKTAYNTVTYGMDLFVMQPINCALKIYKCGQNIVVG